eukprot:6635567-Prymnesium_polylepis.1
MQEKLLLAPLARGWLERKGGALGCTRHGVHVELQRVRGLHKPRPLDLVGDRWCFSDSGTDVHGVHLLHRSESRDGELFFHHGAQRRVHVLDVGLLVLLVLSLLLRGARVVVDWQQLWHIGVIVRDAEAVVACDGAFDGHADGAIGIVLQYV